MNKWTTADGKSVTYDKLEDSHLKNIIKDGYRNPDIYMEADRRGFDVPLRPVDKLTLGEHGMWIESFNSCALSGNEFGKKMSKLWNENTALYLLHLNQFLKHNK